MQALLTRTADDLEDICGHRILLRINPQGVKVKQWALENRDTIERLIQENGALLIRGLKIISSRQFGLVLSELFGEDLINYAYRSTPRTELRGNVYTATEYHHDEIIPQHNENAYANKWAMRLGFLCMLPSETGGETPIADSRRVYSRIDKDIREEFERKRVMYVRNYSDLDLPWTEVFQTEDRAAVDRFCEENQLDAEWLGDNRLRTKQVNPASQAHPTTGERVWFNQAHLFHVSNLKPEVKSDLLALLGEENLPRNVYFGDGTPIHEDMLDHIRAVYERTKIQFPWEMHDLMLLDNMRYSHGRNPFTGERKVLVGMAVPHGVRDTPGPA